MGPNRSPSGNRHRKLMVRFAKRKCCLAQLILRCILDLLCSQNNLLRNPSYELRAACFLAFQLALDTRKSKIVPLALTGLNVGANIILFLVVCLHSVILHESSKSENNPHMPSTDGDNQVFNYTHVFLELHNLFTQCPIITNA